MPLRVSDLDVDAPPSRRPKNAAPVVLRATVAKWFMGHCLEWTDRQLKGLVKPGEKNVPVNLTMAGQIRESTLLPAGPGRLRIIIPSPMLKAAKAGLGSEVEVALERVPPRSAPSELPTEMLAAIQGRPGAMDLFRALSVSNQRAFVRMISEIKSEESRRRRSEKTVERLFEMAAEKKARQAARQTAGKGG